MPACCIKGCHNRTDNVWAKNIKLFCFPKEEVIRQQWVKACGRNEADIKINSGKYAFTHIDTYTQIYVQSHTAHIVKKSVSI